MNPELAHEEARPDLTTNGIWQPLPGETPTSAAIFCANLELGEHPTLQKVADKTGKSLSSICRLSARHHWLERATAYRRGSVLECTSASSAFALSCEWSPAEVTDETKKLVQPTAA
jgi:hypothetical protein